MSDYAPPLDLLAIGNPLPASQLSDTLMRFPGPCGLADLARDQMSHLAPPAGRHLYLYRDRFSDMDLGIQNFGVLAVYGAAKFQPVRLQDADVMTALGFSVVPSLQIYLGINIPVSAQDFFWMPQEMYFARDTWHDVGDAADFRRIHGPGYEARVSEMKKNVLSYMEEVKAVEQSGELPVTPWYQMSTEERGRLVAERRLPTRWRSFGG